MKVSGNVPSIEATFANKTKTKRFEKMSKRESARKVINKKIDNKIKSAEIKNYNRSVKNYDEAKKRIKEIADQLKEKESIRVMNRITENRKKVVSSLS